MNIKINTTCNYRKSVVLKIQLTMCKHPELVKSVTAAWGTGAQVNLNGWGSNGLKLKNKAADTGDIFCPVKSWPLTLASRNCSSGVRPPSLRPSSVVSLSDRAPENSPNFSVYACHFWSLSSRLETWSVRRDSSSVMCDWSVVKSWLSDCCRGSLASWQTEPVSDWSLSKAGRSCFNSATSSCKVIMDWCMRLTNVK